MRLTPRLAHCIICSKESGFRQQQGEKGNQLFSVFSHCNLSPRGWLGGHPAPFFYLFPGRAGTRLGDCPVHVVPEGRGGSRSASDSDSVNHGSTCLPARASLKDHMDLLVGRAQT